MTYIYYICALKKSRIKILAIGKRKKYIKIALLLQLLLFINSPVVIAQYLYEFGLGGGLSAYTGEVSTIPFKTPGWTASAFYRSNFNSRFSVSLNVEYGNLSGHTHDVDDTYPSSKGICNFEFGTRFVAPEVLMEVNFFPYPFDKSVLNSKNLTPYYFVGVGSISYKPISGEGLNAGSADGRTAIGIPFGVGARWLFSEHLGLQLRFKSVKMFADDFDCYQLDDPFDLGQEGLGIHRQDWLYTLTVMLTYSFGENLWDCNCPVD